MSDQQRRCVVVVLAAVALAIAVSPRPAAAQTSTNNAGIEGRVTDESGAVLPGVTVTIQSPALQSAQLEAVTDDAGRYRFTTLPGGDYTVTFSLPGFRTVVRQGLNLDSGFVATVDAQLALGQLEETITVTGESPLVDVRTTTEATNIKKELMETIPTSRTYADVGKLAPGVRLSGLAGHRRQPDRRPARQPGQLRLERRRPDADARRRQHRRHRRLLRLRRHRRDDRAARRQRRRDPDLRHGVPDHHQVGRQRLPRRRPGRVAGTATCRATTSTTSCGSKGVTGGNPMDHYYDVNGSLGGRIVRDRLWFFGSARRKEYGQEVLGFSGGPGAGRRLLHRRRRAGDSDRSREQRASAS